VVAPARRVIKEPGADDAAHCARRVRRLATSYVASFALPGVGITILVWRAQFFVTLTQGQIVETLTLAFLLVLFGYIASLRVRAATASESWFTTSSGRGWRSRPSR
jgi:hypothetical protein